MAANRYGYPSVLAVGGLSEPGCRVWYLRFYRALLVPFGLHHIWNVPFQMQIGEYTNAAGQVFHGDIPRYMAGDPTAGMLSGGFLFKMYGLPAAAIAIWHSAKPEKPRKSGRYHDFRRADLVFDGYYRAYRVLLHVRGADPVHYSRDSGRSGIPDLYPAGDA